MTASLLLNSAASVALKRPEDVLGDVRVNSITIHSWEVASVLFKSTLNTFQNWIDFGLLTFWKKWMVLFQRRQYCTKTTCTAPIPWDRIRSNTASGPWLTFSVRYSSKFEFWASLVVFGLKGLCCCCCCTYRHAHMITDINTLSFLDTFTRQGECGMQETKLLQLS